MKKIYLIYANSGCLKENEMAKKDIEDFGQALKEYKKGKAVSLDSA